MIYKNRKRTGSNGTQSEAPRVRCTNSKCIVTGYQNFTITKHGITVNKGYKSKFNYIKTFLLQHTKDCSSVTDVGASSGLVSFMAAQVGYSTVYALDHDIECINIIKEIKDHLDISVTPKVYSFGNDNPASDIVIVGALIHWIYSCTALYGKFDEITNYLYSLTKKYLLIEWVNPTDPAIHTFHHTSFNSHIIKEAYTRNNFLTSLGKSFSQVVKVHAVNSTRELFLCTI